MTQYLTLDDALHVTSVFGFHVRDAGLLSSALARPAASMFGDEAYPTIDGKAAALLESLLRNHALVDGNKRTGWTLMVAFLWINGGVHEFDTDGAFDLIVGIAEGRIDLETTAAAIAAHRAARLN
ncbi:type II toxin-antitoxin system death-on-curing family toxin [Microbacterium sp. SLBN-146]|uniref:type II toxin-antitoxin system death-on-curing family toxin n=1 Tax=Microbacterium sp. SLBN-146 TaxID=2768457 RepID=UPI001154D2D4|nr:type II toxin-antitoxin system death-on-curing family toxin [Microbacterium sp. SLBN-146]TQJ30292.1 death-on-curing protein [Microbacterium sp. SLBN-146]